MKRLLAASLLLAGSIGIACYQDDTLHPGLIAPTNVLLTDDPFPFDTVGSVNIYISKIEGSTQFDTSGSGSWVEIAVPNKSFDLLTLQQGTTAPLGGKPIEAGQYVAIRMTIDVDKSSIKYNGGADAVVVWPYPHHGEIVLYALVEQPLAVSATVGAEIVIDFDVGRSFLYNLTGNKDFVMLPWLRAVNSASTGTLTGIVTAPDIEGNPTPVQNANVTVYSGDPSRPSNTWGVFATGRTDPLGHYTVAFLPAGTWIVRFEQPDLPGLDVVNTPNVVVTAGATTTLSAFLPRAGAGGSFINIAGPDTVAYGGVISLAAAVGDSNGIPEQSPQVTWLSRDTSIALVLQDSGFSADSLSRAMILGRGVGRAWIVASSGALQDSVSIEVVNIAPSNPVASVTLVPASRTIAVNDSGAFTAELRDSAGNLLTNRQVSWFLTDSSGVADLVWASGTFALVYGRNHGTTHLRAASESKFKDATITVP
jgi:hypothetical protein